MTRSAGDRLAPTLPTGTVTFLLTDVAGSTRLWQADHDAMARAIARHYEIVDGVTTRWSGVRPVEQGEGDSTVSVFSRASDAIRAALDMQLAMKDEPWPDGVEIQVRIGLHTGEAELRDGGNYFGPAISRCARLRSSGHGGQTLLSSTTRDLVSDHLPDGATLLDLGEQRLRDLTRSEHVYQLRHPGLTKEFPPLTSLDVLPNNLPVQLTSFIGREAEMAELRDLLADSRLITLTGTGGCGKTRLALQLAADVTDRYRDGAHWVDFSPIADPTLVPGTVANTLGVREVPRQDFTETLTNAFRNRKMLLVLDNCEHLAAACATLAEDLLRACDGLTVIATSREPLKAQGETAWHVPSLSLPVEDDAESLRTSEAGKLFVDRAIRGRPHFRLGESNAPAVATICRRLDGIPLAIELAAARTRTLTPQRIAEGLADRFRLLTGGARTALQRQRTLEASVEWSHALLNADEQILFRRLSVFAGSFTLEAAEHVCAGDGLDELAILDLLSRLVDRSLLQTGEDDAEGRYRMLETIRDYARHKLTDSGESSAVRDRHLAYFLEFVERAEPELERAGMGAWADRLEMDHDNIRAAMDWSVESGRVDEALRLPGALLVFWIARGHVKEGRVRVEAALALEGGDPAARARALCTAAGRAMWVADEPALGRARGEQAVELARELGDLRTMARALTWRAWDTVMVDPANADPILEEARATAERSGDLWCLAQALTNIGTFEHVRGHLELAREAHNRGLDVARSIGDPFNTQRNFVWSAFREILVGDFAEAEALLSGAHTLAEETGTNPFSTLGVTFQGLLALYRGDYAAARVKLEEGSELARETVAVDHAVAQIYLTDLDYAEGRLDDALARGTETLPFWRASGIKVGIVLILNAIARVMEAKGDVDGARDHAEEALTVARASGFPHFEALALGTLSKLARSVGDAELAEDFAHERLKKAIGSESKLEIVETLEMLAGIAVAAESYEEATRLFGAAQASRDAMEYPRFPVVRTPYDADVGTVREALGDTFETLWKEGAGLTLEDAVAYATRARGERRRPAHGWASLTPTELQVVGFVREGLTNPQIAERMFIARGTVRIHLSHIFAKVDVATRSELAAKAVRRGL